VGWWFWLNGICMGIWKLLLFHFLRMTARPVMGVTSLHLHLVLGRDSNKELVLFKQGALLKVVSKV